MSQKNIDSINKTKNKDLDRSRKIVLDYIKKESGDKHKEANKELEVNYSQNVDGILKNNNENFSSHKEKEDLDAEKNKKVYESNYCLVNNNKDKKENNTDKNDDKNLELLTEDGLLKKELIKELQEENFSLKLEVNRLEKEKDKLKNKIKKLKKKKRIVLFNFNKKQKVSIKKKQKKRKKKKVSSLISFNKIYSYIVYVFLLFIIFYLFFSILLLRFHINNKITKYISDLIPVPAIITKIGYIKYYEYIDVLNKNNSDNISYYQKKQKTINQLIDGLIIKKLAVQYGFWKDATINDLVLERLNKLILQDRDLNYIAYSKLEEIKKELKNKEDFVKIGTIYGDIDSMQESKYFLKNNKQVRELKNKEISDIILGEKGYFIVKKRDNNFDYIFVKGNNLLDIVNKNKSELGVIVLVK